MRLHLSIVVLIAVLHLGQCFVPVSRYKCMFKHFPSLLSEISLNLFAFQLSVGQNEWCEYISKIEICI